MADIYSGDRIYSTGRLEERIRKWMNGMMSAPGLRNWRGNCNPIDPRTGKPWVPTSVSLPMPWRDDGNYLGA